MQELSSHTAANCCQSTLPLSQRKNIDSKCLDLSILFLHKGTSSAIPRTAHALIAGFLSGVTSKLATHPLDVVKKRYQVAGLNRSLRYGKPIDQKAVMSIMTCLSQIVRMEGILGLWKGCIPNIAKVRLVLTFQISYHDYYLIEGTVVILQSISVYNFMHFYDCVGVSQKTLDNCSLDRAEHKIQGYFQTSGSI